MSEIPTASRQVVSERDLDRCVRCGGRSGAWHHRRRRRVEDSHTHEACNGILLCITCHAWVHANPKLAREMGWIVSAWDLPPAHPVMTFAYGWVSLRCDGTFVLLGACEQCDKPAVLEGGLCLECLSDEVCCPNPAVAVHRMCGCRGAAGVALQRLRERMEA